MNVCPKCHNTIVYGMNCCTGKRVLNIQEPPPLDFAALLPCRLCGGFGVNHDTWKHDALSRIDDLEKEVAALKQRGHKT